MVFYSDSYLLLCRSVCQQKVTRRFFAKGLPNTAHETPFVHFQTVCESDHSPIIIWKAKLPIGAAAPRKVNPFKAD